MRKALNISPRTHHGLLPLLCNCLPLFDEICQRFLKVARKCVFHDSFLVRFVALYGIMDARGFSFLGRNVSFCMYRYNVSLLDVFGGAFVKFIYASVYNSYNSTTIASADLLVESLELRDGLFELPNSQLSLTRDDINNIINFICTD